MRHIWVLSYFFEPDLSAGSFRNTSLVQALLEATDEEVRIHVVTTLPNRYGNFSADAQRFEETGRLTIHRIEVPRHANGLGDQVRSYVAYFRGAIGIMRGKPVDLMYASSSKLFTGFLGAVTSVWKRAPFYLDIRDIFTDTIKDVLKGHPLIVPVHAGMKLVERWTIDRADHLNLISGGFRSYFRYRKGPVSEFTNGIDALFLAQAPAETRERPYRVILYAGNIGEGQGLEKIVPAAAARLGEGYRFRIIGSGGTRPKLEAALADAGVANVSIEDPMPRADLLEAYADADYFFIHLNDYPAFRKVLPSKIFELAAMDRPLIAGVGGYAAEFLETQVSNLIRFEPGDVDRFVFLLQSLPYRIERRESFIKTFNRAAINRRMALDILNYLK